MKEDRRIDQAGSVGVLVGFYEREREKKKEEEEAWKWLLRWRVVKG